MNKKQRVNNRRQDGFSLVELMVVIIIIVTLSGSGLYGWQQWQQRQRLWQTAQQLSQFLNRLRYNANWTNHNHILWLKKSDDGWCIGSNQVSDKRCDANDPFQFQSAFTKIVVEEITAGMGFYGVRNTAWPGHIILKSPAGKWKIILSVWGRIRLCELSGEYSCP